MTLVSVIIPSRNEGANLKNMIDCIIEKTHFPNYEIIVVDELSEDGSTDFLTGNGYRHVSLFRSKLQSPNRARNYGARNSKGDILIFLDAHVFPMTPNWMTEICNFLEQNQNVICGPCIVSHENPEIKGYGCSVKGVKLNFDWLDKKQENPYEVPMILAACLAIEREKFFHVGCFNELFPSWGYDEADFCIKSWLLGTPTFIIPNIEVSHIFRSEFPYAVDGHHVNINLLILAASYFKHSRFSKILSVVSKETDMKSIREYLERIDVYEIRRNFMQKRIHDDDWFFNKFDIEL